MWAPHGGLYGCRSMVVERGLKVCSRGWKPITVPTFLISTHTTQPVHNYPPDSIAGVTTHATCAKLTIPVLTAMLHDPALHSTRLYTYWYHGIEKTDSPLCSSARVIVWIKDCTAATQSKNCTTITHNSSPYPLIPTAILLRNWVSLEKKEKKKTESQCMLWFCRQHSGVRTS